MIMRNRYRLVGLMCISGISFVQAGIVRIDTVQMANNKAVPAAVNKKFITYLADNHDLGVAEEGQLGGIIDFLQKREKTNDVTHILIEQPSWIYDNSECNSQVLSQLSKRIQQASPKLTLATCENIDIRHISNAAYDMLTSPVLYQFNDYRNRAIHDTTQKTFGAITFQDVLDEFDQYEQSFSDYYLQQDSAIADIYQTCIAKAQEEHNQLLKIMNNNNISFSDRILKYAKQNSLVKKASLADVLLCAFRPFVDLHIIRTLFTSSHKNIIVAAGYGHIQRTYFSLRNLNAFPLYSIGKFSEQYPKPITINQLREGLSMQKGSFISLYRLVGGGITLVIVIVAAKKLYNWWYEKAEAEEEKAENQEKENKDQQGKEEQDQEQEACPIV